MFYEALTRGKDVSTSQPSPAGVLDTWEALFEKRYDKIVYILMSSGLSGLCMTANGLAQEYEGKVYVVDNHRIYVTIYVSVNTLEFLRKGGRITPARYIDSSNFIASYCRIYGII